MALDYISTRCFTRFDNRPHDLSEIAGEACLIPGRAAFGYYRATPSTVEKIEAHVGYIFLYFLLLPITLPLSIIGVGCILYSQSHENHDRALREGLHELDYPWEYSALQYQLVGKERGVIESWNGVTVLFPDGHTEVMDTSLRLSGHVPEIRIEEVTQFYREDIDEILQIERECFSNVKSAYLFMKIDDPRYGFIAARDEENRIVGFLEYRGGLITSIGRKASHARMGIGTRLIQVFKESIHGPYSLQVRESNVGAIHLYEQMGFERRGRLPNYYPTPREDGLYMVCRA